MPGRHPSIHLLVEGSKSVEAVDHSALSWAILVRNPCVSRESYGVSLRSMEGECCPGARSLMARTAQHVRLDRDLRGSPVAHHLRRLHRVVRSPQHCRERAAASEEAPMN